VIARLTGALIASLVLLAAPTAMAAGALERDAQRVYDDYRSDGRIDPCRHTVGVYRDTLKQIDAAIEEESPAFKPATEAALEARENQPCDGDEPAASGTGSAGTTAAPGTPGSTAPDVGAADGAIAPTDGAAPVAPEDQAAGDGGAAPAAPAEPSTGGATAPAAPAAPAPPPPGSLEQVMVNRPYEGTPLGLLIAGALLACALAAWLAALAARRFGWGEERLAGARHAWGEASFRAGGTWGDFLDWVRLGR
jgi:hypothetical protein